MRLISSQGKILAIIFTATIFFYLPILLNPALLLSRGNDLQEFFWPIYYFVKVQILESHTLPLWNNMFFSGTPLLTDPQSPIFYLPNLLFLFLPTSTAFIVSIIIHTLMGSYGMYLAANKAFKLSSLTSLFCAILYIFIPKLAGYLEAGHFGLINTFAWLPFVLFAGIKLFQTPNIFWTIILSLSISGIFYTHIITFILVSLSVFVMFVIYSLLTRRVQFLKRTKFFLISIIFSFGIIAIALLPQIEWANQTTRFMLLENRDVYPKWNGKIEFIKAAYPHVLGGKQFVNNLDNEKWIPAGTLISVLALLGLLKLANKLKIIIITVVSGVILIALNNVSPIQTILLSNDWYVLSRVSTRIWFIITLTITLLAGFGLEALCHGRFKRLVPIIIFLTLSELLLLSWIRFERPLLLQNKGVPLSVYEFLAKDKEQFRVFCVTRCLSQQLATQYNLETIEGYGTLIQKNYFNQFIQLSQVFWNRYTLALPPFEIYKFREIQPYSPELADYNVKYVISPHKLTDKNLVLEKQIENYLIYKNTINKTRAYYTDGSEIPILYYSPNKITIDTSSHKNTQIILSGVYSPGWNAYLNGNTKTEITETKNALRQIKIKADTQKVEFIYEPQTYKIGRAITFLTWVIIIIIIFRIKKQ